MAEYGIPRQLHRNTFCQPKRHMKSYYLTGSVSYSADNVLPLRAITAYNQPLGFWSAWENIERDVHGQHHTERVSTCLEPDGISSDDKRQVFSWTDCHPGRRNRPRPGEPLNKLHHLLILIWYNVELPVPKTDGLDAAEPTYLTP